MLMRTSAIYNTRTNTNLTTSMDLWLVWTLGTVLSCIDSTILHSCMNVEGLLGSQSLVVTCYLASLSLYKPSQSPSSPPPPPLRPHQPLQVRLAHPLIPNPFPICPRDAPDSPPVLLTHARSPTGDCFSLPSRPFFPFIVTGHVVHPDDKPLACAAD